MTEKAEMKLKPCPFCGATATLVVIEPHSHQITKFMSDHPGSAYVECSCGAGLIDENSEAVVERWNTRSSAGAEPVAWFKTDVRGRLAEFVQHKADADTWREQGFILKEVYAAAISPAPEPTREEIAVLRNAAIDALAGWKYIRQHHGDLYGVGWDRVQTALESVLKTKPKSKPARDEVAVAEEKGKS